MSEYSELANIIMRKESRACNYGDKSKARYLMAQMLQQLIERAEFKNFGTLDKAMDTKAIAHTKRYRESWLIPQLKLLHEAIARQVL